MTIMRIFSSYPIITLFIQNRKIKSQGGVAMCIRDNVQTHEIYKNRWLEKQQYIWHFFTFQK